MKIFNRREENFSVGRPKLADKQLKKKSYIMLGISVLLITILLSGTLVSLNILPKFGEIKGEVVCSINDIPAELRPYDAETNPSGLHEYGFDDPNFYSVVVSRISNNTSCTVTPEQLATITNLSAQNNGIESANGVQYLIGLTNISLANYSQYGTSNYNVITSIDLRYNINLISITISGTNLSGVVDLSNASNLRQVALENNKIETILLPQNITLSELKLSNNNITGDLNLKNININLFHAPLDLSNNKITSVELPDNMNVEGIYLFNNKLISIDIGNNDIQSLSLDNNMMSQLYISSNSIHSISAVNNNLESINLSSLNELEELVLWNNPMTNTKYLTRGSKIEYNPIFLNENFPITIEVSDNSIVNLSNNLLSTLNIGTSTVKIFNENIRSINPMYVKAMQLAEECGDNCSEEQKINYVLDKLNLTMEELMEIVQNEDVDYFFSQEIKVYDITSDKYSIDKDKKEISYSGEFNKDNIILTLEGLTGEVDGDKYVVKDGDVVADTFTLVKVGNEDNNKTETKNEDKKDEVMTTKTVTTKKNDKEMNTTKKEETKVEETTTVNATKQNINKVVTTAIKEGKKNSVPVVPIGLGVASIVVLGTAFYLHFRKY